LGDFDIDRVFELGFLLKCSYLLEMPSEIDKLNNLNREWNYRNNGRVFFLRVSYRIFSSVSSQGDLITCSG